MRKLALKIKNTALRFDRWFTFARRRYLYRVVNVGFGALVAYGVLDGHRAAALLLVVNVALGLADAKAAD